MTEESIENIRKIQATVAKSLMDSQEAVGKSYAALLDMLDWVPKLAEDVRHLVALIERHSKSTDGNHSLGFLEDVNMELWMGLEAWKKRGPERLF
jgi:hypothetical protein